MPLNDSWAPWGQTCSLIMTLMGCHGASLQSPEVSLWVAPGECDVYACSHTGTVHGVTPGASDPNWLPLLEASVSFSWGWAEPVTITWFCLVVFGVGL